jgi:hypothetical protein
LARILKYSYTLNDGKKNEYEYFVILKIFVTFAPSQRLLLTNPASERLQQTETLWKRLQLPLSLLAHRIRLDAT